VLSLTFICFIYAALLEMFGEGAGNAGPVDWSTALMGLLGVLLVGATCTALGLFTSSVTDSQMVAAVLGMLTGLIFWVLKGMASRDQSLAADVMGYVSILSHIESFARGVFSLTDFVYFLSFIFLCLFLSHRMVEAQRWT
jgi:ABC-2 type transport system permease protein